MRIAILTQPLRYNFGGILQNYALQTILTRIGHDVVTLDPPRYHCKYWWQYLLLIFRHTFTRYIRGFHDVPIFAELLQDKETRLLGTNTFKFVDKYICRKEYWDISKAVKEQDYDAYIIGSDQTWRCRYNRDRIQDMFLTFTKGWNVKRIAYASSFGKDTWEGNTETTKICREAIKAFDLVSVRESSGIDICKNVFNVDAFHVLDPTLLLKKEDYMNLVESKKDLNTKEGDLYLYLLDENEKNINLANIISKEMNLTPYTYTSRACDFHGAHTLEERIQPPIELWLKGFEQAKLVLTDSFHACVFSIIFRKQFYLYENKNRGTERYTSLFNMLGINNRSVHSVEDVKSMAPIDYGAVYKKLSTLQKDSITLLMSNLIFEI